MKRVKTLNFLNSQNPKKILNGQNAEKLKHKIFKTVKRVQTQKKKLSDKTQNFGKAKLLNGQNASIIKWSKRINFQMVKTQKISNGQNVKF